MAKGSLDTQSVLGIDVGGTGIKAAPVNIRMGQFTTERFRIPTPQPATPKAIAAAVVELVRHFHWRGPLGCAFPAVIKEGVAQTAANIEKSWIGTDGRSLLEKRTGCPVTFLNDADAAGLAEMTFGAGKGQQGVVILLTLGTGIGSAIFLNGKLLPNTEIGHLVIRGKDSERRASDRARSENGWSWKQWGRRVNEYLRHVEDLLAPDLFIIGGGVSKKHEKFFGFLDTQAPIVPAQMLNDAGIVGAALAASLEQRGPER